MKLTNTQQEIVDTQGNLIVSASAGTGKTHTLVAKISKELADNKDHRIIAAITFTIKAAREIKDRLSIDIVSSFIGTNNSFAIEEVIKPFMKDAYGKDYNCQMTTDYGLKFDDFNIGLQSILNNYILGSYNDNNKNFIFELALKILKKSEVARLYLQAKYFKVYIDEYQDCDVKMNDFFMYLTDVLKIDLFIVGDDKQSLYIWRGANPKAFRSILKKETFKHIFMGENFRSNKQIQNYSNLLFDETSYLYEKQMDLSDIILFNCIESDWVKQIQPFWEEGKSSVLLRSRNNDAEDGANLLSINDMEFKFIPKIPLDEISNDTAWLYYSIAQYIFIDTYSVYDFIYDIPSGTEEDSKLKSKLQRYLEEISESKIIKQKLLEKVSDLALFLGYTVQENDLERFYETVSDGKYLDCFEQDKYKHLAMTCHASKGLQFEQVIVFAEDFSLRSAEDFYRHYVAVTRAKSKLFIIYNENYWAKLYWDNLTKKLSKYNLNIENLVNLNKL